MARARLGLAQRHALEGVRIRDADLPVDATLALGDSVVRVRAVAPGGQAVVPMIPAFGQLAGTSVPMRKLFALLEKVAPSDINVLIEGESGTGKELVANEIVQRSPRADKPFVVVDCGAISPNLVESELFGHLRGSFTGADRDRVGAFEAADGGHGVPRRGGRAAAGAAAEAPPRPRGARDPARRRDASRAR